MFVPGPKMVDTFSLRHSSPIASPSCSKSSGSQEQDDVAAGGKQVAGTEFPRPMPPVELFLSGLALRRP